MNQGTERQLQALMNTDFWHQYDNQAVAAYMIGLVMILVMAMIALITIVT